MRRCSGPIFFLLLASALLPPQALSVSTPPAGWREPAKGELAGPGPYRVAGDFDGNGLPDEARFLFQGKGKDWAVWVFLSRKVGSAQTMRVTKVVPGAGKAADDFRLETSPPGNIVRGTVDLDLKTEALVLTNPKTRESHFFYWDPRSWSFQALPREI